MGFIVNTQKPGAKKIQAWTDVVTASRRCAHVTPNFLPYEASCSVFEDRTMVQLQASCKVPTSQSLLSSACGPHRDLYTGAPFYLLVVAFFTKKHIFV